MSKDIHFTGQQYFSNVSTCISKKQLIVLNSRLVALQDFHTIQECHL